MKKASIGEALIIVAVMTAACSHLQTSEQRLHRAVLDYNNALRWGTNPNAERLAGAHLASMSLRNRKGLRVMDYEVERVSISPDCKDATIEVAFQWYQLPSLTVRTTEYRQQWQQRRGRWLLVSDERVESRFE